MSGRRSLSGVGRISLIYTLGTEQNESGESERVMTASVGEDFAECSWPVSVKCTASVQQIDLVEHLENLVSAIDQGFFMNPGTAPTLYWRWTGTIPPGMRPDGGSPYGSVDQGETLGTGRRSSAGSGKECGIYLMDRADRWTRPDFYGRIHGQTAVSASLGEDFAVTHWPIVVKVHPEVSRETLRMHLSDGLSCIRGGFFVEIKSAVA